jgi:multiple sugar transport system substrate-binding protein
VKIRLLCMVAAASLLARMVIVASAPVQRTSKGPITIEMCVWGMPFENDLYTKVYIPEFERENPSIRVRFHHFEDYSSRVLLSHAGGIAPDVIREFSQTGMNWTRRGMNLPLDKYIDGQDGIDRKDFVPLLWNDLQYRGETFGIPQDINILGLFYNKDLFDKAAMPYPNGDWTWADLKKAVDKLTIVQPGTSTPIQKGLDMAWGGDNFRPFMYQNGGQMWDGDKAVFDSPETAEALNFYRSLMKTYSLTRSDEGRGGLGADKFFGAGRVAMYVDGSWMVPSVTKNSPDIRFGVAPLPRGRRALSVSGNCSWAIDKDSKHPDQAWKLVKFLSSDWALKKYWQALWVAPPARWSALRSKEFHDITGIQGGAPGLPNPADWQDRCAWIGKVLENGWTTLEYANPYTDRMMVHYNEAVDKVLIQNEDPLKALRQAAEDANAEIKRSKDSEALN